MPAAPLGRSWSNDRRIVREGLLTLETVGSTSDLALQFARDGAPSGMAVSARRQSAGRGRRGTRRRSPAGNVYLSVIAPQLPDEFGRRQMLYVAGVAAAETVREFLPSPGNVRLKWPNDVMIEGRKVVGLLVEAADDGRCVVGVGVNVEVMPTGVVNPVTTLRECGSDASSEAVARRCLARLLDSIEDYRLGGFSTTRRRWLELARDLDREISVHVDGRLVRGVLEDIDREGTVVLATDAEGVSTPALRIVRRMKR